MRNFFVNFSGLGQKAEGFGTLFLRSGFLPKWTQTDQFFGHHLKGLPPDSRNDFRVLLSAQVAGSVGSNSVQSTFEADQTQVCPSFPGGFLVGRFDQIVGDQTHDEIFAQRRGQRKEGVRRLFLLLIMTKEGVRREWRLITRVSAEPPCAELLCKFLWAWPES